MNVTVTLTRVLRAFNFIELFEMSLLSHYFFTFI